MKKISFAIAMSLSLSSSAFATTVIEGDLLGPGEAGSICGEVANILRPAEGEGTATYCLYGNIGREDRPGAKLGGYIIKTRRGNVYDFFVTEDRTEGND